MKTRIKTEQKVDIRSVVVGDTMWFSGFWIKVTRIENGKLYGAWPYSPEGQDGCMCYMPTEYVTVRFVTVKV